MKKITKSFKIAPDLYPKAVKAAKKKGWTFSFWLNELIRQAVTSDKSK